MPAIGIPPPLVLSPFNHEMRGQTHGQSINNLASSTWPTANRAYVFPFHLNEVMKLAAMSVMVGTVSAGHVDLGVYSLNLKRIISTGSVVTAAANTVHNSALSQVLPPGDYYAAMACDSTTATFLRLSPGIFQQMTMGSYQMASAFVLPATFVAARISSAYIPAFNLIFAPRS